MCRIPPVDFSTFKAMAASRKLPNTGSLSTMGRGVRVSSVALADGKSAQSSACPAADMRGG